jgi:hypothetical protein
MAKSEYKVIPFTDDPETWEAALNAAANERWELFSTGNQGELAYAMMRREIRGTGHVRWMGR